MSDTEISRFTTQKDMDLLTTPAALSNIDPDSVKTPNQSMESEKCESSEYNQILDLSGYETRDTSELA